MDEQSSHGGPTRIGRDLDALETTSLPPTRSDPAVEAIRAALPSADPSVHFVRQFTAATLGFADGVELTLTPSTSELVRWSSGISRADAEADEVVTFRGDERADHPAYTGVASFLWQHLADRRSVSEVHLFVELTQATLQRAQWAAVAEKAEERTAESDLRLIASRPVNVAIGAIMASQDLNEADAEQQLRQLAARGDRGLWQAATDLLAALPRGAATPDPAVGGPSAPVIRLSPRGRPGGSGAR